MKIIALLLFVTLNSGCVNSIQEENMETKDITTLIKNNDVDGVQTAINNGLNVNMKNKKNESLLLIAVQNNAVKTAKLLVENGADVNAQAANLDSPFLLAGANGQTELVKLFLTNGARFDIYNRYNGTALIPACERGHVETVRVLSEVENFPINHINRLGWTGLMEAVVLGDGSQKYQEIIKILLLNGANKNIPDANGVTALEHAKRNRQSEIVKLLS